MSRLRLAILPVPSKEAPSLQVPVHLTWVVQERFPVWLSRFGDSRNMRVPQGNFLSAALLVELLHGGTPSPWNRAWHTPAAQSAFAE